MDTRKLGRNGPAVSALGLGCMGMTGIYGEPNEPESITTSHRAVDLGVNVWFRQGGYLFLARHASEVARLEKNIAIQNRCGVATRMLEPAKARDIVPELDLTGIVGAAYNPTDGILFPWPFLWGYARQAAAHGVRIFTQTPVAGLERQSAGEPGALSDVGKTAVAILPV